MTDPNFQSPDPNVPPAPQPQQPVAAAPLTPEQDVQWGSFAHLGGVLGFLPSLIIWLVFKDRGSFTSTEAKEALNFQITLLFGYVISWILIIVFIGAILMWAVWIVGVVFSIIAFLQAKDGRHYRYPFAIRLIK
ncbi:DUF4870 domain-containing protein [Agromyces sp. Marseille-P2726]|uniref:DUF4870 domain-containing protein n=1 Tax=Agromyces sp. Marseille-P2726 TaxID=2709132 RepID=UPI00156F98A0|nr:DUF4870 domain-containing protein [Agromyces sp. Marseille-P2726]